MNVIVTDDEPLALKRTKEQLGAIDFVDVCEAFDDAITALLYVSSHGVDVAILDIHMREMSGLELARRIKEASPATAIIFLTGYSEYAVQAFKMHASGYLMKPVSGDELRQELLHARISSPMRVQNGLYAQTFGHFDVFSNGVALKFSRNKSKELLAYLIDRRGAAVTIGEIDAAILNADDSLSAHSLIRSCIADLRRVLEEAGQPDLLIKRHGSIAIDTALIRSDYYDFLSGDIQAVNAFMGEYMMGYEWAEMTTAALSQKSGIL